MARVITDTAARYAGTTCPSPLDDAKSAPPLMRHSCGQARQARQDRTLLQLRELDCVPITGAIAMRDVSDSFLVFPSLLASAQVQGVQTRLSSVRSGTMRSA